MITQLLNICQKTFGRDDSPNYLFHIKSNYLGGGLKMMRYPLLLIYSGKISYQVLNVLGVIVTYAYYIYYVVNGLRRVGTSFAFDHKDIWKWKFKDDDLQNDSNAHS